MKHFILPLCFIACCCTWASARNGDLPNPAELRPKLLKIINAVWLSEAGMMADLAVWRLAARDSAIVITLQEVAYHNYLSPAQSADDAEAIFNHWQAALASALATEYDNTLNPLRVENRDGGFKLRKYFPGRNAALPLIILEKTATGSLELSILPIKPTYRDIMNQVREAQGLPATPVYTADDSARFSGNTAQQPPRVPLGLTKEEAALRNALLFLIAEHRDNFTALAGMQKTDAASFKMLASLKTGDEPAFNDNGTERGMYYVNYLLRSSSRRERVEMFKKWEALITAALPEYSVIKTSSGFGKKGLYKDFINPARVGVAVFLNHVETEGEYVSVSIGSPSDKAALTDRLAACVSPARMIVTPDGEAARLAGYTGKGTFLYKDSVRYEGDFVNGIPDGTGTFIFYHGADDEGYYGEIQGGKITGEGIYVWGSQDAMYAGGMVDGKMHGHGAYRSRFDVTVGEFAEGRPVPGAVKKERIENAASIMAGQNVRIAARSAAAAARDAKARYEEATRPAMPAASGDTWDERKRAAKQALDNYRSSQGYAEQRSRQEMQQRIDQRNAELNKQEKKFNEKYNR